MCYVGSIPISWSKKRQGAIKTSSYSEELCSGRVAMEEAITMWYMLRSLEVLVKVPIYLCGNNLGMIICSTELLRV